MPDSLKNLKFLNLLKHISQLWEIGKLRLRVCFYLRRSHILLNFAVFMYDILEVRPGSTMPCPGYTAAVVGASYIEVLYIQNYPRIVGTSLIRTLSAVPRVSAIRRFHCTHLLTPYNISVGKYYVTLIVVYTYRLKMT